MIKTSWTDPGVSCEKGVPCHCSNVFFCRSFPVILILFQPWTYLMMIMDPLMAQCGIKDFLHRNKYKSRTTHGLYVTVKHAGYIDPHVLVIVVNAIIVSVRILCYSLITLSNTTTKKLRIIIVSGSTIVSANATIDPSLYSSPPLHCFVFSLLHFRLFI